MLSFRQIEDAGAAAVALIAETEQSIINDMARRIAKLDGVTAATNYQALRLEALGKSQEDIVRELARALNRSEPQIIAMFDEAATRAIDTDNQIFRAAGKAPIPLAENAYLQQIIRAGLAKTMGEYRNLTRTTAATATQQFEHALDLAYQQIISGGMDYQTAIKRAISGLAKNGLATITYPSGHTDYLDVATRRAVLTGVSQTAGQISMQYAIQQGTDIMELTAHGGARPSHALWQGRLVSLSGKPGYLSLSDIGYGTVTGFKGANCAHDWFAFFEGISELNYTYDQLRAMNSQKVVVNGSEMDLYDATQKQRHIERQIRRYKREESALAAAGQDNSVARGKVREWQARQRDFIKESGLTRQYFREAIYKKA